MTRLFAYLLLTTGALLDGLAKGLAGLFEAVSWFLPEPTYGATRPRSSKWPAVRAAHLAKFPECAVCGKRWGCTPHHILPYHLRPELELDRDNLLTLCGDHHLLFGHLLNWSSWNESVVEDAAKMRAKIITRPAA